MSNMLLYIEQWLLHIYYETIDIIVSGCSKHPSMLILPFAIRIFSVSDTLLSTVISLLVIVRNKIIVGAKV